MRRIVSHSPYARFVGEGFEKRIVDPWPSYGLMNILPTSRRIATYQAIVRALTPKKELTGDQIRLDILEHSLAQYQRVGIVGNAILALFGNLDNQEEIVSKYTQGILEVTDFEVWPALGYLTGACIVTAGSEYSTESPSTPSLYKIAGDYSGGSYEDVVSVSAVTRSTFRLT